jgi:YggT family protein
MLSFLVQAIFDFYTILLLIRILLEMAGVNYQNVGVKFLLRITDPILKPLSKIIPKFKGINLAGILVLFVIGMLKLFILIMIRLDLRPNPLGLLLWTLGELLNLLINLYFYAILIRVVLHWVLPQTQNPAAEIINRLTNPVLKPFQRVIPPIANVDISPLVAMVCLQGAAILFVQFITAYGNVLSLGNGAL